MDNCLEPRNFTAVVADTVRDVTDVFLTGNTAMCSPRIETTDLSVRSTDPTGEPALYYLHPLLEFNWFMATICVDVGTSVIKTVAFDDRGTEIALAREESEVLRPAPGFSEQDMYLVWNAVAFTVRTVLHQLPDPVRLISLTAQGDGCWLVDADGHPTGPAILWNDARAAAIVDRWRAAGVLKEAFRRNGSQTFSGLPNGIFSWLKEHDPDRLERSHKSLCCNGWIFYNLTGRMAIDESDASVPFFDVRERRYSPELLQLYGLEWAERLLPDVLPNDQRVGELRATAAAELGLPAGLPVVMSPYDIASTAIGVGAVSDGQACSILGTTLCTEVVMNHVNLEGEPSGLTIPFGPPGFYLRSFPTLAGSEVIHWTVRQLGLSNPSDLSQLAATVVAMCGRPLLSALLFSRRGARAVPEHRGAGLAFRVVVRARPGAYRARSARRIVARHS